MAAARISMALEELLNQILLQGADCSCVNYGIRYYWELLSSPLQSTRSASLIDGIHQLNRDWSFLRSVLESIHQWSDAAKVSCAVELKIEAAAEEIAQNLEEKKQIKNLNHEEVLELVHCCQGETQRLMTEIKESVDHLSLCSFQVNCTRPLPDGGGDVCFSFWTSFVVSVIWNLRFMLLTIDSTDGESMHFRKQVYAWYKELDWIRDYIVGACGSGFDFLAATAGDNYGSVIDNFLNHVASVIVRTAIQSCNYWCHYKMTTTTTTTDSPLEERKKIKFAELLVVEDLQREIDPTNPYFMELHLHFLIAHCKIGRYQVEEKEVVQSSCGEITAVLLWIASLFEAARKEGMEVEEEEDVFLPVPPCSEEDVRLPVPPCSELLIEICLLETELFLKKLLRHESLSSSTLSLISAQKSQTKHEFSQILQNLRRDHQDLLDEKLEHGKKAFAVIEQVIDQVASLCQSFEAKKISESMLKNSIRRMLLKIVIFRADSFLTESLPFMSNYAETFVADGKDQIALLLEQLIFLKPIKNVMDREEMDISFVQIESLLREITSLSYLNLANKRDAKEMIKKINLSSVLLLDKLKHRKRMLIEIGPQFPLFEFPKTHKLGFIDFLYTNLGELLKYDPVSIAPLKHYVEEIQQHLKSLSSFLVSVSESDMHENPELKDVGDRATEIAYKVEYVIDSIVDEAQWQHFFWFHHQLEELRLINELATGIRLTYSDAKVPKSIVSRVAIDMVSQERAREVIKEMVVNLSDEEQVIIDQLTRGSSRRGIVSIVGMPGLGKTTLARKVYNNQNVTRRFHCRAWCYVSQVYEKKELLLKILHDMHGLSDEICQMTTEDLESKLRQCLLKNKYLIVMDDVWDARAWNDLQNSFPDDNIGSRILMTSRHCHVALEIEPNGDPHLLRSLFEDESWILLEGKVFQGEGCPQELLPIGKKIAQRCGGLPLATVTISGLLQRTEKSKEFWENILESLSSEIMSDPEARCNEIFELSYKHLPGHLRACFLYLGVFLEERDIPVSKLIRFWLAEGFIPNTESRRLEDIAEAYLVDLINRSLVIVSKRRSNGQVKSCRLHDLILVFCRSKAKSENFLQLLMKSDEPYSSFPSSDYGFEFDFHDHLAPVTYKAYRLSIFLKRNHFVESRPSGPGTRSLIFFASTDAEPRCPYDISFICHNFKFLRVLDFESINIGVSFPVEIGLLVRLRYLAVSGYLQYIPKSIANLRKLETLIVKGLRGKVVLPKTIWQMTSLRHLHVNIHVAFKLDDEELGGWYQLENLVSFSRPSLSCGEDSEQVMKRFPYLRKLKCIFFESRKSSSNCNQFPRLSSLTHLESLNIFYYGRPINTTEFILPSNLRKLTLSNFHLPWNRISAIGKLPKLEVLKLLSGAFEGPIWDMGDEEFQELKFLKLDSLNVAQWNASCDHLPKLERLVLQNCKELEKIPHDFAEISMLEMIEVHWCGQSAENSAKGIGDSTGEIKVLISSSYVRS
ncbi:putative late blight resistance protein homolog R1A-4 [Coffea arabica]|uniref:Late blight resistance protein homolog R1A-4 n=1 Tax=Coffea arabica TaxID=13443 RepID=A0ABM4X9M9_COFAR|nr:putative late blight resistance protein homolog R1A-4 isoform X2 [Coffea arabica]